MSSLFKEVGTLATRCKSGSKESLLQRKSSATTTKGDQRSNADASFDTAIAAWAERNMSKDEVDRVNTMGFAGSKQQQTKANAPKGSASHAEGPELSILPASITAPLRGTPQTPDTPQTRILTYLTTIQEEHEPLRKSEHEKWKNYVTKYAYNWPNVQGDRLALRRLRMAAFREYQRQSVGPQNLDWMAKAEIVVGAEMLLGGNCVADAELFDHVDGPVRHFDPSEQQNYKTLYGFLPEEVKAFRENEGLVLAINRAASVQMKPELSDKETENIKHQVQELYNKFQTMKTDGRGLRNAALRDWVAHGMRIEIARIEEAWLGLVVLAEERRRADAHVLDTIRFW